MSSTEGRTHRRAVAGTVLACAIGAVVTTVVAMVIVGLLCYIPGTPYHRTIQDGAVAAARGQEEGVSYLMAPERDAEYRAGMAWWNLFVLATAVLLGSLVTLILSKKSWLCGALGGLLPGVILQFVLPFGTYEAGGFLIGVSAAVAAWVAALFLLRTPGRPATPDTHPAG